MFFVFDSDFGLVSVTYACFIRSAVSFTSQSGGRVSREATCTTKGSLPITKYAACIANEEVC